MLIKHLELDQMFLQNDAPKIEGASSQTFSL